MVGLPRASKHAIFPGMSMNRLQRPRDPIQLGKLIVDIATGQVEDREPDQEETPAIKLAKQGGKARAAKLSAKRRREIAQQAAQARWGTPEK
jgi:hypothetical protein